MPAQPPELPRRSTTEAEQAARLAKFGPMPSKAQPKPTKQPEPTEQPEVYITKGKATGRAGIESYLRRQAAEEQRIRELRPNQIKQYEVQFYFKFKRKPDSREELVDWIKTLNSQPEDEK